MAPGLGWVQDMIIEEFGSPLVVGQRYVHPEHGSVTVVRGCFFDPIYGRLSNWWTWRVEATGVEHSGYGGWQHTEPSRSDG